MTTTTTATLTATQVIYGITGARRFENGDGCGSPIHPALAILAWEDNRTDVHGVACSTMGRYTDDGLVLHHFDCHCGFETDKHETKDAATAELVEHALTTCAACQGPKPTGLPIGDNFPRCSNCAF
jgi:hypothetical protein